MDVNATRASASEVGQDAALDTTKLPADHAPRFLAEAKRIFEDRKPPFVTSPGNSTAGSKRPVFLAKDGQRPLLPIRTDLVAKHWGSHHTDGLYWTLDLNGERFIVQSFPNKGCISGAKWVYCSWTGVGEEFHDLPLAFTCINGEYTSTLGSRGESTAATHPSIAQKTSMANATAHSLHDDHPRDIGPLPGDHPVEYLDEAKNLYVDSKPPFVIAKTKKPRRHVFLAAQDGRFSTATEAEVMHRAWDSANDYPTLDLDGKRYIVSGNAGGFPGGYQYHLWLGSTIGRVKKVAAYRGLQATASKTSSGLTEHLSKVNDDPLLSSSSDDEEDEDLSASATGRHQYFYDAF